MSERLPRSHPLRHVVDVLDRAIERLIRRLEPQRGELVLDYGCGEMPYRSLFGSGVEVEGADLPGNPLARWEVGADGTIPAPDERFDIVLSTQVLEHVEDPKLYLSECARVLRPGGRLLLSTHGIMIYHPDPVDLWRWTWAGLERIVTEAGFRTVHLEGVMGLPATGLQLLQDGVYYRLRRPGARRAFGWAMQRLIGLADRRTPRPAARHNALVFALVAEREPA